MCMSVTKLTDRHFVGIYSKTLVGVTPLTRRTRTLTCLFVSPSKQVRKLFSYVKT